VNREALLRLADKLEGTGPYSKIGAVPANAFGLNDWTCGTTACAIGHACNDVWFKIHGLTWDITRSQPLFRCGTIGWLAVCKFFNTDLYTVKYLFSVEGYPDGHHTSPSTVSARLREYAGE
jgi:hypothetical protein